MWKAGGKGSGAGDPWPSTLISEPNKVQQSQFQTPGILLFTGVQKLYEPEFHNFCRVCYKFWTIYGSFTFFMFIGEIDHFSLDLLKRSNS